MKKKKIKSCNIRIKNNRLIVVITTVELIIASIVFGFVSESQAAETGFPTKAIQLIIAMQPGGGFDNMARPLVKLVGDKLGQPIILNYFPGAGGRIGFDRLYRSNPDGYTLAVFNNSAPTGQALFSKEANYDIRKVEYLININAEPTIVVVHKDSQFNDVVQFVEYAKSHPGEVKMGTVGVGSRSHLGGLKIMETIGAKFLFIPYSGGAGYKTAVLNKEVDFGVSDVQEFIGNPNFKMIVVNNSKRSEYLPDVPTWKEKGFENIEAIVWRGFVLPPGVPKDRLKILQDAFRWAIEQPQWKEYCKKQRYENDYWGPEKFKEVSIREYEEAEKYRKYFQQ